MTAYTAIANGNWNATTGVWSPDGSYPGENQASDTAAVGSYAITLNVSPAYKLTSITVSTGHISVDTGANLTLLVSTVTGGDASAYGALDVTGTSGSFQVGDASNLASIVGGATGQRGIYNKATSTGIVQIYGSVTAGGANGASGMMNNTGGTTAYIYGSVYGTTAGIQGIYNYGTLYLEDITGAANVISVASGGYGIYNTGTLIIGIGSAGTGIAITGGGATNRIGVVNTSGAVVQMNGGTITGGTSAGCEGLNNQSNEATNSLTGVTITGGSNATAYGLNNSGTIQLIACTEVDMTAPAVYNTGTITSDIAEFSVVVAAVTIPGILVQYEAELSSTVSAVVASTTIPSIVPLYFGPSTAETAVIVATVTVQMATTQFGFFHPQWMWPTFRTRHARRRADRMTAIARRNTIRV